MKAPINAQEAFNHLLWQTRGFVKDIIAESVTDPSHYSMRLEVSDSCVKVLVYNSKTDQIIGQPYDVKRFLELCREEKIEFQLNSDVRALILKSDEVSGRKLRWV